MGFRNPYLCCVVIGSLFWTSVLPSTVWASDFPRGDIDDSQAIDALDAAMLQNYILGRSAGFSKQVEADLNFDGRLDVADVLNILHYDGDWDDDSVPDDQDAFPFDQERSVDTGSDVSLGLQLIDGGQVYASAEEVQYLRVDADSNVQLPFANATTLDSDGDGLENSREDAGYAFSYPPAIADLNAAAQGGEILVQTDSLLPDCDRDGLSDKEEAEFPTDALNPDTDLDGVLDGCDDSPLDPGNATLTPGCSVAGQLTSAQRASNAEYQIERITRLRDEFTQTSRAAGGSSLRGTGFQGPASVGSGFESVQSDQFTGAFSFSIPIAVPPGRNGMQPSLDLLYRSSNSHSWLGQGWKLEVGRIERASKDGPPKYTDPSSLPVNDGDPFTPLDNPDTFMHLSAGGGSELNYSETITVDGENCGVYFSVVDSGAFTRYLFHSTYNYWEAQSKDGSRMFFGGNPNTNPGGGDLNSVQETPILGTNAWALDEAWDLNGSVNKIAYTYQQPAGTNNLYLQRVQYNYVNGQPKATIDFEISAHNGNESWASYRESYRSGMKVTSQHFLTNIIETVTDRALVYSAAPERVRKYSLAYLNLDPNQGRTISCLASVQEFGETDFDVLPSYTLDYSRNQGSFSASPGYNTTALAPFHHDSQGDQGTRTADVNGDGLPDLWQRWHNGSLGESLFVHNGSEFMSEGGYETTSLGIAEFSRQGTGDRGTQILDINGDLLPDLWQRLATSGWTEIAVRNGGVQGFVSAPGYQASGLNVNAFYDGNYGDAGTRAVDLNADGLTDLWQRWFQGGWHEIAVLSQGNGNFIVASDYNTQGMNVAEFAQPAGDRGTRIIDLNGDGLPDLWNRWEQNGCTHFEHAVVNNGRGGFIPSNDYSASGTDVQDFFWEGGNQTLGVEIVDLNGDQLSDLWQRLEPSNGGMYEAVALNVDGSGHFASSASFRAGTITGAFMRQNGGYHGVNITDLNGDGLSDLWQRWNNGSVYLENAALNSGPFPNLLISIDNGHGGTIDVEYTPQTKAWMTLYDPDPERRVEPGPSGIETNNHIPYVTQCVSKITRIGLRPNHLNPSDTEPPLAGATSEAYTTLYRYSGGIHADHEFRGFGKVKEIDGQTGNFSITEFHQDYVRKGQVKSVRSYVGNRLAYRVGGSINGAFKTPLEESATSA